MATVPQAPAEVVRDREFVSAAVRKNGHALVYASAELQGDRAVVLAAVSQDARALYCAAAAMRGDKDIVLVAVRQDGRALKHASAELQHDRVVVLASVTQCGGALVYASSRMQADNEVVQVAIAQVAIDADAIPAPLYTPLTLVVPHTAQTGGVKIASSPGAGCAQDCEAFGYAALELRAERAFVLAAVGRDGAALRYASAELRGDLEVRAAGGETPFLLRAASISAENPS
jgi:hypothetical protein